MLPSSLLVQLNYINLTITGMYIQMHQQIIELTSLDCRLTPLNSKTA